MKKLVGLDSTTLVLEQNSRFVSVRKDWRSSVSNCTVYYCTVLYNKT